MRNVIKYFVGKTYKPLLTKYLSKTRKYKYKGINLIIPPEVFHPAFFFSTKLILRYIDTLPIKEKTLLEFGAGSGLISMYTAKRKAKVTAIDINPVAIEYLKINSVSNNIEMEIIQSDMFENIPLQNFDFIIINPPYYKKNPKTYKDYAWYCGENGEYFIKLFSLLCQYMNEYSNVLMILSDGCDLGMINKIASQNNFTLRCVYTKQNWLEKNYIFKIEITD